MVSSDIWMGSGATVSMIPEQKLYLGTFSSIATPATTGSAIVSATVTTAGTEHTSDLTVITDAEIDGVSGGSGGELLLTLSAHSTAFTFGDETGTEYLDTTNNGSIRIFADNGDGTQTSIDVIFDVGGTTPSLSGDVTLTVNADGYEGAEIAEAVRIALTDSGEAITATRSGNVLTVTNTNGGYVTNSTESTVSGVSLTNTAGGAITGVSISSGGSGYSAGNVTILTNGTDGVIAIGVTSASTNQAVITLNGGAGGTAGTFTGNFTLPTNMYRGCYLNIHAATGDALTDRVLIQSNAAETITVNNSLASDITGTPSNYYGVIEAYGAVVPGNNATTAQLLSDHWVGLASNITIPTTNVTMDPMNLFGGGTRNYIYQHKTTERTSGGGIDLHANSFWPLYYALGIKNITTVDGEESAGVSTQFALTTGSGTGFIYHPDADVIHRTEGTVIIPPLPPNSVYPHAGYKKIPHDNMNTEFITYEFTEENGQQLPSFGLEYTLRKGDQSGTIPVDASKEDVYTKIYPGSVISTLTLNADTTGPVSMNLSLAHKNTYVAPTGYRTSNGETDIKQFINYGGRLGETDSLNSTSNLDCEELMRPFFFADGTISMFGQDYIRLASMNLTINNGLQETAYIGRYDKNSVNQLNGQREYTLRFTGHVTDAAIFTELQNQLATALSSATSNIVLRFTKENGEEIEIKFENYMVISANFPISADRGPIMVDWEIRPLKLTGCTHKTYWAIQG